MGLGLKVANTQRQNRALFFVPFVPFFHTCAKFLFSWTDMKPTVPSQVGQHNKGCVGEDALVHCSFGVVFVVDLHLRLCQTKPGLSAAQKVERTLTDLSKLKEAGLVDVLGISSHLHKYSKQSF